MEPLDALIVGAGFSGLHTLSKLRTLGFKVKIFERDAGLGGVWYSNRYPGARVDSDTPVYQLQLPEAKEVYEQFEWRERFPGREELQRYFQFADKVLGFSADIVYNTNVTSADFDESKNIWRITTNTAESTYARHLILCIGFAAKRYTPPFQGLDKFAGEWYHSGVWPEEKVDLIGKRVAVVGTGSSGVQIIQELGPQVAHLTVYQRTPNLAIPMQQVFLKDVDKNKSDNGNWQFPDREEYPEIFTHLRKTFGGLAIDFAAKSFSDATPAERQAKYEYLWKSGGFSFWLGTYMEVYFDQAANDEAYAFWAEKTRARLDDPVKRDLVAPLKPPHAWGTKRPSLESSYYEVLNQANVDVIDVRKSPVVGVTETGIQTKEGVVDVDVIILATGFDSVGGILDIQIKNGNGFSIQEKWIDGTKTSFGLSAHGFPNMYWLYGPHAPTAFANGPTCGGIQSDWICELMVNMRRDGLTRVEATSEAEAEWTKSVHDLWNNSLCPATESWYQGANIPGRIRAPLFYFGGIPTYSSKLESSKENNYEGFTLA